MEEIKPKVELSARRFMVYCFSITYCVGHLGNLILALSGKISTEVYIALWGGFTPMMILIAEWYFKREDRVKLENGGVK